MVNFLTVITFPGEKSEEIGKLLPKLPKLPEFVKPPKFLRQSQTIMEKLNLMDFMKWKTTNLMRVMSQLQSD